MCETSLAAEVKKNNYKKIYEKNSRQIPTEGKTIYLTSTSQNCQGH